MALVVEDRVVETSTTTGVGAFTLAGAVTGFRAFSSICAVSDTCYYTIEAVDSDGVPTGEWECGLGTYSAASELTRTTPQRSSNANAAVNFSAGTKLVSIGLTSTQLALYAKLATTNTWTADQAFNANVTIGDGSGDTHDINGTVRVQNEMRVGATGGKLIRYLISSSICYFQAGSSSSDTTAELHFTRFGNSVGNMLLFRVYADTARFEGALQVLGNTTLGNDAAVDTLTVNAAATFNGGVVLGDGSGDVITVNGTTTFNGGVTFSSTLAAGAVTTTSVTVTDDAYGAGWNGSNQVPTKNAVYDKIAAVEAVIPSAYTDEMARDAVGAALVEGTGIDIVVDDAVNTITISATGGSGISLGLSRAWPTACL